MTTTTTQSAGIRPFRGTSRLTERVEQITDELLDAMERHGPPVDLVEAFARPLCTLMIRELRTGPSGRDLTAAELSGTGRLLLGAGLHAAINTLALGAFALLVHPDQLAGLRDQHSIHQCLLQQIRHVGPRTGLPALLAQFPTLRLAVAPDEVPLRADAGIYGVHRLPVTWD